MNRQSLMSPGRDSAPRTGSTRTISTTRLLTVAGVGALMVMLAWTLWLSGQLDSLLEHRLWPPVGPRHMLMILLRLGAHTGHPARAWPDAAQPFVPGPCLLYPTWLALFLTHLALLLRSLGTLWSRFGRRPGFATHRQVTTQFGAAAVSARTDFLRPALADRCEDSPAGRDHKQRLRADPLQVARRLGTDGLRGQPLYIPANLSMLVEAAPQAGKTTRLVIPSIVDAPGPVLVTSTRLDICAPTFEIRTHLGPTSIFEPQGSVPGVPRLRWSPIRGAEDRLVAIRRASGFAAGAGLDNAENGDFFRGYAADVIQSLLHAAALDGKVTATDVYGWATHRDTVPAESILRHHGVHEWADALSKFRSATSRDADTAAGVIRRAFSSFADPRVLDACSPRPGEEFDVDAFLHESGTLYLVGSKGAQATVAPLLTALIEDIAEEAKQAAFLADGGRLDPWLTVLIDEPYNTASPESLPSLMSEGGGSGIATSVVPQNRWQVLHRWGERGGRALIAAANVQVYLGGLNDAERLRDIQALLGPIDEVFTTHSTHGDSTNITEQIQRHELISLADIRTLPESRALVFATNMPPVEVQVPAWWEREDVDRLRAAQRAWRQRITRGDPRR
jgi:type IV secretion system protein VirD4